MEGLEAAGRSLGSSPTQMLAKMVAEVGPSTSSGEACHIRPTVGEDPHKEFCTGVFKRLQRNQLGKLALPEICQYQKSMELLIHK